MKTVILAGGKGTRLKNHVHLVPKPLVKIEGKPILEYQIDSLKKYGLIDIIISIGYCGEKIIEYFGNGSKFGVNITYLNEASPLGTGGVLFYLKDLVEADFILLFGDLILNIDWRKFINYHNHKNGIGTFLVHPNNHPYDSDLLVLNKDEQITNIISKDSPRELYDNIVKSGVHIFRKEIFQYAKPEKMDLEKDIVSKIININHMYGYRTTEYVKDMGTEERLAQVSDDIKNNLLEKKASYNQQKCIFLDRDGTINKHKGLLFNIDDFELEDKVSEAIKMINYSEYLCIVITNQSVVARNLCTEEELKMIHKKMHTLLGSIGAYLDDVYYCPHHPDNGYKGENKDYKIKCNCRKPGISMIEAAQKKYNINLNDSYMIGDTSVDIQTAKNAGIKSILLRTGEIEKERKFAVDADFVKENLYDAILNVVFKEAAQ